MPPRAPRRKVDGGTSKEENNEHTAAPQSTVSPEVASSHRTEAVSQASKESDVTDTTVSTRLGSKNPTSSALSSRGRKGPIAKPPFAGRRSQAARAELEKEEAAKKAAEQAEALQNARKQKYLGQGYGGDRGARGRGRGGRGRGRGGFAGDSDRVPIASGPFSAGQVTHDVRSGYAKRSGWGAAGSGGSFGGFGAGGGSQVKSWGNGGSRAAADGVKIEGSGDPFTTGMGRMRSAKTEDGGYISSDDEDPEGGLLKRQNVDELQNHLVDLSGVQEDSNNSPFAPVRLPRVPVKDRKVGLSVEEVSKRVKEDEAAPGTAVTDKRKAKASSRDAGSGGSAEGSNRAAARAASSDAASAIKVKPEPTDDTDLVTGDATASTTLPDEGSVDLQPSKDPPSSPESRRRAKERVKNVVGGEATDDVPFERPKTPSYPTQQEVDEFHRKWDNRATVFAELGRIPVKEQPMSEAANDGEGNVNTSESSDQKSVRDDQVYLFQFPPVLPDLHPASVKQDPDARVDDHTHNEAMDIDQEGSKDTGGGQKTGSVEARPQDLQPHLAPGLVGKLRILKSGRAFLEWGGKNTLMLELGAPSACLQNVMLAQVPDVKPDADPDGRPDQIARAMGLGEVKQKFVMIPQFD